MSAPPRDLEGSIGSRIRVVFGETGADWLLLLNHDDGNTQWQSRRWSTIPNAVAKQLNNCTNKGRYCRQVDFGPSGEWYINGIKWDNTGGHCWWDGLHPTLSAELKRLSNMPDELKVSFGERYGSPQMCLISGANACSCSNIDTRLQERIEKCGSESKAIEYVRLFHEGNYFIKDDNGAVWSSGIGKHCSEELEISGAMAKEVAVAKDGSWMVLCDTSYLASTGVSEALKPELDKFFSQQRQRQSKRTLEIRAYHDRIEAAAKMEQELRAAAALANEMAQKAREEDERIEAEEAARKLKREQEERDVAALAEEVAKTAREDAERLVKEAKEQQRNAQKLAREEELEKEMTREEKRICELEQEVQHRKRHVADCMESLPPEKRRSLELEPSASGRGRSKDEENVCVVCQDHAPTRAVVPCGHMCLCDQCATTVANQPLESKRCPLCRNPMQSTLKIYLGCS